MVRDEIEVAHAADLSIMRRLRALGLATLERYDGARHSRQEHAFALALARATESLGALDCLFSNGWQNDAFSMLRTLADIYIEVLFILTDEAALLEMYFDHGSFAAMQSKRTVSEVFGTSIEDQLRAEYERNKEHVIDAIKTPDDYAANVMAHVAHIEAKWSFRANQGWNKLSAFRKAKAIDVKRAATSPVNEIEKVYRLIYSWASENMHAGMAAVSRAMRIQDGVGVFTIEPRMPTNYLPLFFGSHVYLKILDNVNDRLKLGCEATLEEIDKSIAERYLGTARK